MRDRNADWDEGGDYDYSPNELARLSTENPRKYRQVVESNLDGGDSVEKWEQRNMERAREFMAHQQKNRRQ